LEDPIQRTEPEPPKPKQPKPEQHIEPEQPKPEYTEPEQLKPEQQPEPEPEPEQEDEEYGLHPQLQEILQYLADDEHVSLIRKQDMHTLNDTISNIHNYMDSLACTMKTLTESVNGIKMQLDEYAKSSTRTRSPNMESDLLHIAIKSDPSAATDSNTDEDSKSESDSESASNTPLSLTPVVDVAPVAPKMESDDPLAKLITEFSRAEPISAKGISFFNEYFDATFIYNFANRASRYQRKLNELGIKNCLVSAPSIPECSPSLRIVHFLKDIVQTAKACNYHRINILCDILLIHNALGNVIYYLQHDIRETDWDILQYCCMDHKYQRDKLGFDWQYYLDTNPDINYSEQADAVNHWRTIGEIQGRVPQAAVVRTDSNNALAFSITSKVYDPLLQNLELLLNTDPDLAKTMSVFDFREHNRDHPKAMTIPNLFIRPKTGNIVAKSLKWHVANYTF